MQLAQARPRMMVEKARIRMDTMEVVKLVEKTEMEETGWVISEG